MAFNLIGLDPKAAVGKEIMISMFIWHPLWEYVESNYPEIASKLPNAHFNSQETLQEDYAKLLSNLIDADIANGNLTNYINKFKKFVESLPDTDCYRCFGIGKHRVGILKALSGPCEACNGTGRAKQFVCKYSIEIHDFALFSMFLKKCGGFVIK